MHNHQQIALYYKININNNINNIKFKNQLHISKIIKIHNYYGLIKS